jgi:hypothetical protein
MQDVCTAKQQAHDSQSDPMRFITISPGFPPLQIISRILLT